VQCSSSTARISFKSFGEGQGLRSAVVNGGGPTDIIRDTEQGNSHDDGR